MLTSHQSSSQLTLHLSSKLNSTFGQTCSYKFESVHSIFEILHAGLMTPEPYIDISTEPLMHDADLVAAAALAAAKLDNVSP